MKNKWDKLGRIFYKQSKGRHPRLLTHFSNPLPIHINNDTFRIFYNGRDCKNRSSIGAVDIDIVNGKIIQEFDKPIFKFGPKNSFYCDGISIGNFYKQKNSLYMLFMGWQAEKKMHWRGDIGRLKINSDLSLSIKSPFKPLLTYHDIDPISLSYPFVMKVKNHYMMWYGSTLNWDAGNGEMLHVINVAKSSDGDSWERMGLSVPFKIGSTQAFSRPTVIKNKYNKYEMWFSYRGKPGVTYRIGYASSDDGIKWDLDIENAGIAISKTGWDSKMIEYPYVFLHKKQTYMLYNGNDFGKTGIGLAIRKK